MKRRDQIQGWKDWSQQNVELKMGPVHLKGSYLILNSLHFPLDYSGALPYAFIHANPTKTNKEAAERSMRAK